MFEKVEAALAYETVGKLIMRILSSPTVVQQTLR